MEKGKRSTFSLFERKSCKKKQTNVPLDCLCVWALHTANPDKPLRKSLRCAQNSLLAETAGAVSDAVGYSGSFDLVEAFLLVRRRNGYSSHSPILVPPSTAVKAYWRLNKPAGISIAPSAKKPSDALGSRKEQINVRTPPEGSASELVRAELYLALPIRYFHTHRHSTCKVANFFLVLFLFGKEKVHRSPFAKGKNFCILLQKEKVHRSPFAKGKNLCILLQKEKVHRFPFSKRKNLCILL